MDNNPVQSTQSITDNKTHQLSKKVWDLEGKKDSMLNINKDGSIPMSIQMKMQSNKLMLTDYVDGTGKRRYVQKVNNKIEIKDI